MTVASKLRGWAAAWDAARESVIDSHLALARIFLPRARKIALRTGMEWLVSLQSALRALIYRHLGAGF